VLLKSERTPDDSTAFIQTLTPYHPAWAKIVEAEESRDKGENEDNKTAFNFIIRNPRFGVDSGSFVSWGDRLFRVSKTKQLGRELEFLRIKAFEHGNTSGPAFGLGAIQHPDGSLIAQTEPTNDGSTTSPFWPPEED